MARSKRKSSTRKGFRTGRRSGGGVFWYALGSIIALGLLGAAGFWQFKTSREMAFDTETLCPSPSGPVAMTAILFDLTDPLTKAQSSQLAQYIEQEFSSAAAGTQFTMGVVSEDAASWGATEPLCKPIMAQDARADSPNCPADALRLEDAPRLAQQYLFSLVDLQAQRATPLPQ